MEFFLPLGIDMANYNKTKEHDFNPSLVEVGKLLMVTKKTKVTGKKRIEKEGNRRVVVADAKVYEGLKDTSQYKKVYNDADTFLAFCELSKGAQRLMAVIIADLEKEVHWFYYSPGILAKKISVEEYRVSELLKELVNNDWIYKSTEPKKYWINLLLVSSGSRVKLYEEYRAITKGYIEEEPIEDEITRI